MTEDQEKTSWIVASVASGSAPSSAEYWTYRDNCIKIKNQERAKRGSFMILTLNLSLGAESKGWRENMGIFLFGLKRHEVFDVGFFWLPKEQKKRECDLGLGGWLWNGELNRKGSGEVMALQAMITETGRVRLRETGRRKRKRCFVS